MSTTAQSAPKIVANTPPGTQAAMIDQVLHAQHPRLALPAIASHFGVTLADLQTILNRHGYPDQRQMRAAAERLLAETTTSSADAQPDRVNAQAGAAEDRQLARVAVADLHPDPDNLRENVHGRSNDSSGTHPIDDIEQLADSIREIGLVQPIIARRTETGHLVVVAGHRRLAAVQRLRWTHVDVVIRPPMRPDDVIAAMLIENGQRRDLDPIEEARGIRRLKAEHELTDLQLARKIGRSQSYVSARLALLNLTADEQEAIRNGDMSLTGATNLGRLKAGKVRQGSKGNISIPHYGPTHDLAPKASARCKRLGHTRKLNGGVACGPCWDSVLRADERDHLQETNARRDDCVTCGSPLERPDAPVTDLPLNEQVAPYFEDETVQLHLGDALATLRQMPDESINCCVTSPPYFGLRDYGEHGQYGLEDSPAEYVATMVAVFREVRRVLASDGTFWLNIGDSYYSGRGNPGPNADDRKNTARRGWVRPVDRPGQDWGKPKNLLGIPWRLAFALQDDGWNLRSDIIWAKTSPMPEAVRDRCTASHEHVFMLTKSRSYYFDGKAIEEPATGAASGNSFRRDERISKGGPDGTHRWEGGDTKNRRDVWTLAPEPFPEAHFATFPSRLPELCILAGSRPGDVVLDPFHGSGTTGMVAQKHGRRYVGIELNQTYLDLSLRTRLANGVLA